MYEQWRNLSNGFDARLQTQFINTPNGGTTAPISHTQCYKYVQGVMSNDSLGSARWATFRNRRMTAKSRNPHKDWFDASYQLRMVNPKPCIIYNVSAMSSGGLRLTQKILEI